MKAPRHYKCVLCGREFVNPIPHKCAMGFLKRIHRAAKKRGWKSIFIKINEQKGEMMKVWVYKFDDGGLCYYDHEINSEAKKYVVGNGVMNLIGTLDLPIEPVKKEVVKEINLPKSTISLQAYVPNGANNYHVPSDAYDIKLTYKVKE